MLLEELIMQLIVAINTEDLLQVKNIVNNINNRSLSSEEKKQINKLLNLTHTGGSYPNPINNKCIDYIMDNLNLPFYKEMLFQREQYRIRQEKNPLIIEEYIQKLLNKNDYPHAKDEQQVIRFLIEAATLLKDREKISYYFSLIQKKFFNKEGDNL